MSFQHFELEEWQSKYETTVKHNLADSGCHPVRLEELLQTPTDLITLSKLPLHYPPVGEQYQKLILIPISIGVWHRGREPKSVLIILGSSFCDSSE